MSDRTCLTRLLVTLSVAVLTLPSTIAEGTIDGPLRTHLSEFKVLSSDEGPYPAFNKPWERVFQVADDQKVSLVARGRYGTILAVEFIRACSQAEGIDGELCLLVQRAQALLALVRRVAPEAVLSAEQAYVSTEDKAPPQDVTTTTTTTTPKRHTRRRNKPPETHDTVPPKSPNRSTSRSAKSHSVGAEQNTQSPETAHKKSKSVKKAQVSSAPTEEEETSSYDGHSSEDDPITSSTPEVDIDGDGDTIMTTQVTNDGSSHPAPAKKIGSTRVFQKTRPKKKRKTSVGGSVPAGETVSSGSDVDDSESHAKVYKASRERPKTQLRWALSYFKPEAATVKGEDVWFWACQWCGHFRTTPRSPGCTDRSSETSKLTNTSNFVSHMKVCPHLPAGESYKAWVARGCTALDVVALKDGIRLASGDAGDGMGIKHEKVREVTQRGFRELFVKAVLQDDLPFSFGENEGMNKVFSYILPNGITVPHKNMVRRDLDLLHAALMKSVDISIEELESLVAIIIDGWTAKSSVYAFAGLIGSWIDGDWVLHEHVLDLLALDGDHSGASYGKSVFTALEARGISKKLIASTADNATSNDTMNRDICERIVKHHGRRLNAKNMQIGCAAHVLNLVVQAILHVLGCAPDPEEEDTFEHAKDFPLVYDPSEDPDVIEELAKHASDTPDADEDTVALAAAEDISGYESESSSEYDGESEQELDRSLLTDHDPARLLTTMLNSLGLHDASRPSTTLSKPDKRKTQKKKPYISLNPPQKLHTIVVDILHSEPRRKRFRNLTRKVCESQNKNLVLIRGMPVRWNTTHAEIERGIRLKEAVNQWISDLDKHLTGKKAAVALSRKKKLEITVDDWEMLGTLSDILQPFYAATLDLSQRGVPTLPMVIPIYDMIEKSLKASLASIEGSVSGDKYNLATALNAGLAKLTIYKTKALTRSHYPLLGAVLHPNVRGAYFEDPMRGNNPRLASVARTLLEYIYEEYDERFPQFGPPPPPSSHDAQVTSSPKILGLFAKSIHSDQSSFRTEAPSRKLFLERMKAELNAFFGGAFPAEEGCNILLWWKEHVTDFPVLSRIARDILAIPGVSVAVERLFSHCRHTMTELRSSMATDTASKAVVTKDLLKDGLGDGIEYLKGHRIWHE